MGLKAVLALVAAWLLVPKRLLATYAPAIVSASSDVSSTDISDAMKTSYLGQTSIRAIKNNNPLNIRVTNDPWKGKIPLSKNTDRNKEFEQFEYWVYGIRAAIKTLKSYYDKHKLHTVTAIVNRWAPPVENDTNRYVLFVASKMGVSPTSVLLWNKEVVYSMVRAMAHQEAGKDTITKAHFDAAWSLV